MGVPVAMAMCLEPPSPSWKALLLIERSDALTLLPPGTRRKKKSGRAVVYCVIKVLFIADDGGD